MFTTMTSFRGQASWANMTSPGGKLTALVRHLAKRVNKAGELTYLSTNIALHLNPNFVITITVSAARGPRILSIKKALSTA
jgi:hypothetical protein